MGAPFKLPKREAGCPHPRRDGLGTWRCGRTHPSLHLDRAEARMHAGTHTRGHAQRHTLEGPRAHTSVAPNICVKSRRTPDVQARRAPCQYPRTFASACKRLRGKKRTPLRSRTHARVKQEAEEGTLRSPASHTGAQPRGLAPRRPHAPAGAAPPALGPPRLPSFAPGKRARGRSAACRAAKSQDPGRDTPGSCARSRVPPGSGGHLLKVTARQCPLAPRLAVRRNPRRRGEARPAPFPEYTAR